MDVQSDEATAPADGFQLFGGGEENQQTGGADVLKSRTIEHDWVHPIRPQRAIWADSVGAQKPSTFPSMAGTKTTSERVSHAFMNMLDDD